MKDIPLSKGGLNPRLVVEKATLKKIAEHVPEAALYMKDIRFILEKNKLRLNLQALPPELIQKIQAIFS